MRGRGKASKIARTLGEAQMTGSSVHLENLELLVDELIKDRPLEPRVRQYMEACGLTYTTDIIERMSLVLATMDKIQGSAKRRGRENDQST